MAKKQSSQMANSTGGSDVLPQGGQDEEVQSNADKSTATAENERRIRISTIAYAKALSRGFEPGWELDDWLEAERQVDDELAARASIEIS